MVLHWDDFDPSGESFGHHNLEKVVLLESSR